MQMKPDLTDTAIQPTAAKLRWEAPQLHILSGNQTNQKTNSQQTETLVTSTGGNQLAYGSS